MPIDLYEAEGKLADMQTAWSVVTYVQNGKPLEFAGGDSFQSAGTYRKHRKSDDIEIRGKQKITIWQKIEWEAERAQAVKYFLVLLEQFVL